VNTLAIGMGGQLGGLDSQGSSLRATNQANNQFMYSLLEAFTGSGTRTDNSMVTGQSVSQDSDSLRPNFVATSPFLAARTNANVETAVASPKAVSNPVTTSSPATITSPADTTTTPPASSSSSDQHWYGASAADDAYWAKQPAEVQQLREIDDPAARAELATELSEKGYAIDVPIMVWGWDAAATTALRQQFDYTWVPASNQPNVTAAPGLSGGGITPYDPNNPPAGSIAV